MSLPRIKKHKAAKDKRPKMSDMNFGTLKGENVARGAGIHMLALRRQKLSKFKVAK